MQGLINDQLVAKPALAVINQTVREHFCEAKNRNACEQGNHEAMGTSMRYEPPAPVQRDIFSRTFLNGHLVALQREIDQKVPEDQHDQQIQRLIDRDKDGLHSKAPERISIVASLARSSTNL